MVIGIDGSRAFLKYRTGIEEYSYQVIRHLREALPNEAEVRVYVRKKIQFQNGKLGMVLPDIDFPLPENWSLVPLWAPRFWTQIRLSLEMLFHPVNKLFIPAHTVPVIHPKQTTVVVHGLEYEMSPESYSLWERFYMRASIRFSVRAALGIIAVSKNTKKDLVSLYKVSGEKIKVIYEGYKINKNGESIVQNLEEKMETILFIGRLEERKNVKNVISAFEMLKETGVPHTLILAGKNGYGSEAIFQAIRKSPWRQWIKTPGYITQEEKNKLLSKAQIFVFPSLYEGFGLPVLEAQAAGTPVVTSSISSLPEVGGEAAIYIDPSSPESMRVALEKVISLSEEEYKILQEKGYANVTRFSWQKCAREIAGVL